MCTCMLLLQRDVNTVTSATSLCLTYPTRFKAKSCWVLYYVPEGLADCKVVCLKYPTKSKARTC